MSGDPRPGAETSRRSWTIVELAPEQTHPLRLAVLRADTESKVVVLPRGRARRAPCTSGSRSIGVLAAVSSWIPKPLAARPGSRGVQLRGMATAQRQQGTGVGGALLEAGVARAAAVGAELVWANARDTALGFYARHGFAVLGDGFVDETTTLPHHVIVREL